MPQQILVEEDTQPVLSDTLDTAKNASGGSVTLYVQKGGSTELIVSDTGSITDDSPGSTAVKYQFNATQTSNLGTHKYEWEVTYSDGDKESFPKDGHNTVEFDAQLNRGGTPVDPDISDRLGPYAILLLDEQSETPSEPAVDDWGLYVDTDGDLQKIDQNGTVTNIGAPDVSNDGTLVNTTPTDLNFGSGVDASDDGDNTVSMSVNESEVDHDSLQNFVANDHVDHSAVVLTAGNGLAGGGDLTASRTFDIETDGVALDELDQSIAPTWTGEHTFADNVTLQEAQTLVPADEPATPAANDTVLWNDNDAIKAKFDDGTNVTLAEL